MEDFQEKFPEKSVSVLHKFDTEFCSDSVEWCPHEPERNYFVCANYQLEEDESGGTSDKPRRRLGRILLFSVDPSTGLTLHQTLNTAAILDQKWCHKPLDNSSVLATADAEGCLTLYKLLSGSLVKLSSCKVADGALLLSLDWSTGRSVGREEIVCSDSKGALHVVEVEGEEVRVGATFKGHEFEAWIAAFYCWDTNVFFSGGDDSKFLMFDRRVGEDPIRKNKSYNAGVTCIQSNSFKENILATGSYDPQLKIWDLRNLKTNLEELEMPGTMWRLKFDPYTGDNLISACMLGGVHIVDCGAFAGNSQIVESFYGHEKIAYGADWSFLERARVQAFPGAGNCIVASCSFYDHLLYVYKVSTAK